MKDSVEAQGPGGLWLTPGHFAGGLYPCPPGFPPSPLGPVGHAGTRKHDRDTSPDLLPTARSWGPLTLYAGTSARELNYNIQNMSRVGKKDNRECRSPVGIFLPSFGGIFNTGLKAALRRWESLRCGPGLRRLSVGPGLGRVGWWEGLP